MARNLDRGELFSSETGSTGSTASQAHELVGRLLGGASACAGVAWVRRHCVRQNWPYRPAYDGPASRSVCLQGSARHRQGRVAGTLSDS